MPIRRPNPVPDRWLLQVRGLAQVMVEDQEGRYIGPSRNSEHPNLVENQIPGAAYTPGQLFSSVFLDQSGTYTFTFITQFPHSSVHISLSPYNAVSKFSTFYFQGIPMTERSQARLVYDTVDQSATLVLALDREGDGEIEQIQPTILSPQASDDIVPPTTQINIEDDDVVTASAADNPGGAGILRTYYSTDGTTHAVYTEPFSLPPDARIVMAYSEDRAGNLEYPGAVRPVLGLSETRVVMTAKAGAQEAVRHTVNVMNLNPLSGDPLSVTGQLEWEASTEAPWLQVEPSAGTTPYPMTLFMHATDLAVGHYEAKVIVRSLTPGTVRAERTLDVHGEIVAVQRVSKKGRKGDQQENEKEREQRNDDKER
jgi:hypothetical protein